MQENTQASENRRASHGFAPISIVRTTFRGTRVAEAGFHVFHCELKFSVRSSRHGFEPIMELFAERSDLRRVHKQVRGGVQLVIRLLCGAMAENSRVIMVGLLWWL